MRLFTFLPSLLCIVTLVSTVAVPKSTDNPHPNQDQNNRIHLEAIIPSLPGETQSKGQQRDFRNREKRRDFVFHGKNEEERSVALCEAGFVADCRQVIEGNKAAAIPEGADKNSPSKMVLDSALPFLTSHLSDDEGAEEPPVCWGIFPLTFIATSIVVIVSVSPH